MNDSTITFSGWVGSEVTLTEGVNQVAVASFRVGCTPRRFRGGRWEDGETIWYAVKAWRTLATNVAASVRTGEPVVVSGKLVADVWKREDGTVSTRYVVVASSVGHDLTRGTSVFRRVSRSEPAPVAEDDPVREVLHSYEEGGPRLDSDGRVVADAAADGSDRAVAEPAA
ncbi:single-stranded DNA-binding protein [Nocardioides solisilvae]|uniref:single-stranded DNA-binding protein n=1 Tax=Nocardioides solisilvae TaxID=1542435 RepID=UPI000D74F5FA|nr:single-stranded DNA-binding protein [Nocardioides solisilvae]